MMQPRLFANLFPLFPIGLGAMPLSISGRPSEQTAISVIETFLEMGGNFIDTADVYGLDDSDRGHNEKLIHKALKAISHTDPIIVATKGGATRPQGGWGLGGGHPHQLRLACENSLKHLNISCHSLYYLHGPDPDVPLADSLGELIRLKEEGKINHIGIANVSLDELHLANQLTPIMAVQNRLNPFCKADLKNGVTDFCKQQGVLYVPYCPLGGWAEHVRLATSELFYPLTSSHQVNSYVICLAWALHLGEHILPIPGMDKIGQVLENQQAITLILSQDDMQIIDNFPDLYFPKHIELKLDKF